MSGRDRIAKFFRQHRRQWVSAIPLTKLGGLLAWRTEVSRCRTELGMDIANVVTRTKRGSRSYYRYLGKKKAA